MARAFGYLSGGYAKHLEDNTPKVPRFFMCVFIFYLVHGVSRKADK